MTERSARLLAHGLWLGTILVWSVGAGLSVAEDARDSIPSLLLGLPIALYATLGALVARRRPGDPIGWLFGAVALSLAASVLGVSYAEFGLAGLFGTGGLPWADAGAWIGVVAPFTVLPWALPTFLVLFPDGRLPSRPWRLIVATAALGGALMVVGVTGGGAARSGNFGLQPPQALTTLPGVDRFTAIGLVLASVAALGGVLALARRFRSASAEDQQPLRLLVVMIAAMGVASLAGIAIVVASQGEEWGWFGWLLAILVDGFGILVGIPVATAAAVLTYGLYDVGVVMRKTVVYGALVVLFVLLIGFVSLALSPLAFLGTSDPGSGGGGGVVARVTTAGAIVVLALALGLRPAKRLARRLVFGRRATPYEAMAELSERLGEAYATEDVLPRMAGIVRASTGADVARVWLLVGRELRPVASAPGGGQEPAPLMVPTEELPEIAGARAYAIRHQGALLGALTLTMPAAEPLSKTGERLVSDLAAQAGLMLRNVRLIEDLRASRRRLVAAQDAERRRLERNIHDGAQQQLVALAVKLRLAEQVLDRDPAKARELLAQVQAQAADTLEDLRDLARGIYPPLLADEGLSSAIVAQSRKVPVPVEVEPDGLGRYGQDVEAAIYFCVLEALQNVTKYAGATSVRIGLREQDATLTFTVSDDGVGFDREATTRGTGLQGMADRLDAVGGSLEVLSAPGEGTTVLGRVPIR